MNYQETLAWMFSKLPMYQRHGKIALKKDLTNTLALAHHLGNPHQQFKSVHVAGTNGKGSTSHMIASVLQEAGYKVGLYTSPHLKDFRERIKVNGQLIRKNCVINFIKRNRVFLEKQGLSFFEMTVGLAFEHFAKQNVDIAIIEVGLGGRLDSTNIIIPEVAVITNIGLDHTQMLGETLEEIAFEKAGVIKNGIPIVIGERQKEIEMIFINIARERRAPILFAEEQVPKTYTSDLIGSYQKMNIRTAIAVARVLIHKGFQLSEQQLENGLKHVVRNTGILGRWQVLGNDPMIICDTAHNKEGLIYVIQQLKEQTYQKLHIVLGVVNDKDLKTLLPIFPRRAIYYFCRPDIPRGLDANLLQEEALSFGLKGASFDSVKNALNEAVKRAVEKDFIFIGGSTFVVAEVL